MRIVLEVTLAGWIAEGSADKHTAKVMKIHNHPFIIVSYKKVIQTPKTPKPRLVAQPHTSGCSSITPRVPALEGGYRRKVHLKPSMYGEGADSGFKTNPNA
jgi:hypothetical protein